MLNLHLSSASPSKRKRGNHETSIWWDKLGHAQRPAKPGCGFQMELWGKPTDTHSSFTTPVNSYSKVIVVWLMRGFPLSVFIFSGGETQQLEIPEGHVDLQRKQLSPNRWWNHPYISIVRGNWVTSSIWQAKLKSYHTFTFMHLHKQVLTHFLPIKQNVTNGYVSEHSESKTCFYQIINLCC